MAINMTSTHVFKWRGGGPNVEFGLGKFALPAGWVIEVQKCISNDTIAIFPRQVNSNIMEGVVYIMTCQQLSGLALSYYHIVTLTVTFNLFAVGRMSCKRSPSNSFHLYELV